jgi:hypothetical protein
MTRLSRSTMIGCLIFGLLVFAAQSSAQTRPPLAEQIAQTYGLASFGKIEAIRYTFNLRLPGLKISRSWVWHPKTDQVSYEGKDKNGKLVKVTYFRSQLGVQPAFVQNEIDPDFVNDEYNLLFPLHVYWDSSADVQDLGMQKLPVGKGPAKLVRVKYPSDGGYTPGDTWDLYLGSNRRVEEFAYHRGGPTPPSVVIATWGGYKKAGPLLISTYRRGTADGKPLKFFLSNLAVKLMGSDKWVSAR